MHPSLPGSLQMSVQTRFLCTAPAAAAAAAAAVDRLGRRGGAHAILGTRTVSLAAALLQATPLESVPTAGARSREHGPRVYTISRPGLG